MQKQLRDYSIHVIRITFNKEAFELAEKLIDITPGDFEKKVLFDLSGAGSTEGSIKAASKFTGKKGIIAFKNSYHGTAGLAMQATNLSNNEISQKYH